MKAADYSKIDTLVASFFAREIPPDSGAEPLDGLFEAIEQHAGELTPEKVHRSKKALPYSRANVRRLLRRSEEDILHGFATNIILERSSAPEMSLLLQLIHRDAASRFRISLRVLPLAFFQEPEHSEERSRRMALLLSALARFYPPTYAIAHDSSDEFLSFGENPSKHIPEAPKQVDNVYWLNILGKELVELIGRARALTTPAFHLEELPGGSVLFLTRPTPGDFASDEARVAQARALVHLRPDLNFDAELAKLRERSAMLAPVARNWDPDITELLGLLVDEVGTHRRQRETTMYNQYRPPPVSEWLPLSSAPPTDIQNGKAAVERYSLHAERLAALLHAKVPQVMDASPESLTPIDYHFWSEDYPRRYDRVTVVDEALIPSVGAYLGEMLVARLGGRWVPRQNPEEAYVALGDRAWLPFLRSRHYFQSQQSVLDYSLTKFYREAERHLPPGGAALPLH